MHLLRGVVVLSAMALAGSLAGQQPVDADAPVITGCPSASSPIEIADDTALFAAMAGRWVRCGGGPLPGMPAEQAGFELTADGRWYALYVNGSELLRGDGLGQAGRYRLTPLVDEVDGFGLSFLADGGAAIPGVPVGTIRYGDPPLTLMRAGGTSNPFTGLVPWTGASAVTGSPVPTFLGCPASAGALVASSPDEERRNVAGLWITCSGTSPFDQPVSGEVGLELTADGTWSRLVLGSDGFPHRSTSAALRGIFSSPDPGIPSWIELRTADFGPGKALESFSVAVFSDPPQLYVRGARGASAYVRWDGGALVPTPSTALPPTGVTESWVLVAAALTIAVGWSARRASRSTGTTRWGEPAPTSRAGPGRCG